MSEVPSNQIDTAKNTSQVTKNKLNQLKQKVDLKKQVEKNTPKWLQLLKKVQEMFKLIQKKDWVGLMGAVVGLYTKALGRMKPTNKKVSQRPGKTPSNNNLSNTPTSPLKANETTNKSPEKGFDHKKIESYPFEVSKKSGITLCSRTAYYNALYFGIPHRGGDADTLTNRMLYEAKKKKREVFQGKDSAQETYRYFIENLNQSGKSIATVCFAPWGSFDKDGNKINQPIGSTKKRVARYRRKNGVLRRSYGHQAVAFKSAVDGDWYVLDPYTRGRPRKPIPLLRYIQISRWRKLKTMFVAPRSTDESRTIETPKWVVAQAKKYQKYRQES